MLRSIVASVGVLAVSWTSFAQAAPCAGFVDVDDSSPFCVNVAWMKNRGITLGLTATQYDPNSPVSRLQMAAFMYRLGFQNAFLQGGNSFGAPAVLGSVDAQPVEIRAAGARVMRYEPNSISPNIVGGSPANSVTPGLRGATIAGGGVANGDTDPNYPLENPNRIRAHYGFIGGGYANHIGSGADSFSGAFSAVAGGFQNAADGNASTIGGGTQNTAGGAGATVGGGTLNSASGSYSTVGGGFENLASNFASTVPGGHDNVASGNISTALGSRAKAIHDNTFVWSGDTAHDIASTADGEFIVYAPSRVRLFAGTHASGGCEVGTGNIGGNLTCQGVITAAAFVPPSDRAEKIGFVALDTMDILARVTRLAITEWAYKSTPDVRHIGPMGQDFKAAFGLGATDKGIATIDADGVALAAIQGLNAKLEATVAEQAKENARLRAELAELRSLKEEVASIRAAQSRDNLVQR